MLLFISGPEIMLIVFVVLMVFGADKIPEIARGLGKGMAQIKNATNDIKSEIQKSADKNEITKDIVKEIGEAKKEIEDIGGTIKRNL
ncbi:MAG: twin-arginine translocase TatA/TatE family subunit [Flavobacteriaceae bacterium]|jgi:sec-independent protein translocase protein TatA|nr:twin-arginine translocase TatA/TatE family subunit [Bacteroidota bacterium]MDT8414385.1 twin-arginine translocase TatA/TatE family subunit [Flavobacteriaceae bacterium]